MSLVGVIVLLGFGMPFHVLTGGAVLLADSDEDQESIRIERRNRRLGWLGLALIIAGTVVQIYVSMVTL
jgi:hypothetical protein